jgi:hypothetical protein
MVRVPVSAPPDSGALGNLSRRGILPANPDFSNWKDHDAYKVAFDRLLRDLKAEGQQAAGATNVQS